VLLVVLLTLARRARNTGFLTIVFVAWYGAMRVITDFLRVDRRYLGLTGSQLTALAVGLACLYLLARYRGAPPRFASPPPGPGTEEGEGGEKPSPLATESEEGAEPHGGRNDAT
jgi:hypothetical protein